MIVKIGGIEMLLVRKKMKRMYIRVKSGSDKVTVTAPMNEEFSKIEEFVLRKIDWIKKTQVKMGNKIKQPILQYVNGEMVNAFGVDYKLVIFYNDDLEMAQEYVKNRVVDIKTPVVSANKVIFVPKTIILVTKLGSTTAEREKIVSKRLDEALLKLARFYVAKYEPLMDVKVKSVVIKKLRGSWGKCSYKIGEVWLNRNLSKCSPQMVEYIVVHEMCHLLEANHSAEFKALMTKFYPNWKKTNMELNRYYFEA